MLFDIIPLPFRYRRDAEITSVVPYSTDQDEFQCLGWSMDPDVLIKGGFNKYKTVEIYGRHTIERVFTTKNEIDFNKPWWTSKEPIYPIYQSVYTHNSGCPITIKYLDGVSGMLMESGTDIHIPQSIHTHILAMIDRSINWSQDVEDVLCNRHHYCHRLIIGDDDVNIDKLQYAIDLHRDPEYNVDKPYVGHWYPEAMIDELTKTFLIKDNSTLADLKHYKAPEFGIPMCSVITVKINEPFAADDEDVKYSEENIDKRWAFMKFVSSLSNIGATDYQINLKFNGVDIEKRDLQFFNRYLGAMSVQDSAYGMEELLLAFARWQWSDFKNPPRITGVSIVKYWTDEAYVMIAYEDNHVDKYYIDLACYNTISRCVLDTAL